MTAGFTAGAEAMRARIIAGIRRWWGDARRVAGHRWPGHPHWLECAVARLDAGELLGSSPAGLAGGADALLGHLEGQGQRHDGGSPRLVNVAVHEFAQPALTDSAPGGELLLRASHLGGEKGAERLCGLGHTADGRNECRKNLGPLVDFTGTSADTDPANETTPAAPLLSTGEERPRPNPNPKVQAMTTLHAPAPAAQPLLTCTGLPFLPAGDHASRARNRRVAGSLDLRGLGADELRAARRSWWGRCDYGMGEVAGIDVEGIETDDGRIEITGASVADADEFLARWGAPVTHERAKALAMAGDWTTAESDLVESLLLSHIESTRAKEGY